VSFSELEYSHKRKQTRRDKFLSELETLTPWPELLSALAPHYHDGKRGRPPIGLEVMLRMTIAQHCLGLSDEGIEDALYDSQAVRQFCGVDIAKGAPDATTLLQFRHLLEEGDHFALIMRTINAKLEAQGILLRQGTLVDATLIAAPSATKNKDKVRDPEMHSTKKGNQWYFGMKAHIGVDIESGAVHSVIGTAANVSDISQAHALLHGHEQVAVGDAGYQGAEKREAQKDKQVMWFTAMRRSKRQALDCTKLVGQLHEGLEKAKASVKARVEHPFHIVKNLFKHKKARYVGIAKNTHQLTILFAMANLLLCKQKIKKWQGLYGTDAPNLGAIG
jgi:IS5 family transposase